MPMHQMSVPKIEVTHATSGERGGKGASFLLQDVPLVKFIHLPFTHMPGESYRS